MVQVRSKAFQKLVGGLKASGKRIAVVETCCGGLINASIMAVPGSSAVYYGGSVAYNTRKAKPLLLNDADLHSAVLSVPAGTDDESEADAYIRSKMHWTAQTSVAFCKELGTDFAVAEGGASGPTFRPQGLDAGFAVLAVAGRKDDGSVGLLAQTVVRSTHNDRERNMRMFADAAAELVSSTVGIEYGDADADADKRIDGGTDAGAKGDQRSPPRQSTPSHFTLDRATALRSDRARVQELHDRDSAKFVLLRDATECLFDSSETAKIAYLHRSQIPESRPTTFLGIDNHGAPVFSVEAVAGDYSDVSSPPDGTHFANTRTHAPMLSEAENELALYATAMASWKKTHKFCSVCGQPLQAIDGGTCLKCLECGARSWPRQDPSIIVLITNRTQDKALLARSVRHPKKVHTALAGFVEAGESFEKAVVRESFEETGVYVDWESIRYIASQPWPFPRSTMIGFRATADDNLALNVDENELVSASWFDRPTVEKAATVRDAVMNKDVAEQALEADSSLQLLIPPKGVLARTLIDNWLDDAPY